MAIRSSPPCTAARDDFSFSVLFMSRTYSNMAPRASAVFRSSSMAASNLATASLPLSRNAFSSSVSSASFAVSSRKAALFRAV